MSVEVIPTQAEMLAAILARAEENRTAPPLTHLGLLPSRFTAERIARMFDVPLRIIQPMPTKANARRYGR